MSLSEPTVVGKVSLQSTCFNAQLGKNFCNAIKRGAFGCLQHTVNESKKSHCGLKKSVTPKMLCSPMQKPS